MLNTLKKIEIPETMTQIVIRDRFIKYNKEDLLHLHLIGNNAALLGDHFLLYEDPVALMNALRCLHRKDTGTFTERVTVMENPPLTAPNMVKMRTLKEDFLDAQYIFFRDYAQDSNKSIKYSYDCDEDYPAMLNEISDLQDTLLFTIKDLLPKEYTAEDIRALNADKVFSHYFEVIGDWWLISFFGLNEALDLLEDFFNRYFPLLQREIFFKNYIN